MELKEFGKRINRTRKEQGITSEKLAEICDVSAGFLRHLEGGRKAPSVDMLIRLCNALTVSPDFLLAADIKNSEFRYKNTLIQMIDNLTPKQMRMLEGILNVIFENTDQDLKKME